MKKKSLSEIIFEKMTRNQPFQEDLIQAIKNPEVVNSGMSEVWAGLLKFSDEKNLKLLSDNNIYPNEKSEIIHQIFFNYNVFSKRRENLAEKMNCFVDILEKTEEGKMSIVKDIEKYFEYYGTVFVEPQIYNFIETIYKKYAKDENKIYYLEVVNQLKFFNTLQKSMFELKLLDKYTIPVMEKLVNTSYFNRVKKIKFSNQDNQQGWGVFCEKFKQKTQLEIKLPEKGNVVKKNKI